MAAKKTITGGPEPSTQPVVELLTSILNEVQKQVLRKTPKRLEGKALEALDQFREIVAALALQPLPTISLKAEPSRFGVNGGAVKLTWSSTNAQTVSIDPNIGEVPTQKVAGGSSEVFVAATTVFTATAKGPCGSATATATVTVAGIE